MRLFFLYILYNIITSKGSHSPTLLAHKRRFIIIIIIIHLHILYHMRAPVKDIIIIYFYYAVFDTLYSPE